MHTPELSLPNKSELKEAMMYYRTGEEFQYIRTVDRENLQITQLNYDSPESRTIVAAHSDMERLKDLYYTKDADPKLARLFTVTANACGSIASHIIRNGKPYREALETMLESNTCETLSFPRRALRVGQLAVNDLKVNRSFYTSIVFSNELGLASLDIAIVPASVISGLTYPHQDTNQFIDRSWGQLRDFSEASFREGDNSELLKQTLLAVDVALDDHHRRRQEGWSTE